MPSSRFNVQKLIDDLGGPSQAARITGSPRTAPYRWLKSGSLSTYVLEKIKAERPDLDLNEYFVEHQ